MFFGKKKAVTFSYDDAVTQDIHLINLLDRYGLKCTFNLNSELLGKEGMLIRENQRIAHYKIIPERVREIYEGHEVAVHTLTHPSLSTLHDEEIVRQTEQDRKNLEALVGYEVVGMAYPNGSHVVDERVERVIEAETGVRYARGTVCSHDFSIPENLYHLKPTVYHLDFDRMMELGRKFLEYDGDEPALFYIWGHAYEMDYYSDYWSRLEEFFRLISGHDDVYYGTNTEVLLGYDNRKNKR